MLQIIQPLIYTVAVLRWLACIIVLAIHVLLQAVAFLFVSLRPSLFHSLLTDNAVQYPIRPLYRFVSWLFMAVICRMLLGLAGYGWIPVEMVSKKKG